MICNNKLQNQEMLIRIPVSDNLDGFNLFMRKPSPLLLLLFLTSGLLNVFL